MTGVGNTTKDSTRPEVHRTEVDGVTTFWAADDGPLRGVLTFRVGVVDEPVAQRGWSHLLEHLALARHGGRPRHHNGAVDLLTTRFGTHGGPDDVSGLLSAVCTDLHAPPPGRLAAEQRILAVEAQQVGRSEEAAALQLRLGLAGAGRIGRPEWGVPSATEAGLAEWADAYFTRANAVLWLTGPPPAGLRLPLPDGTPVAVPVGEQVVPAGRHWLLDDGVRAAAVSVLLGDSRAASLIEHVLHQRLFQRLRMDEGIAYDPGVRRSVLGPRHRHLLLTTDTRPDDRLVAAQALVQVVDELAEHGPTESEISACRDELTAALGHIEVDAVLDRAAARLLLGLPEQSLDELLAEVHALDGESARTGWQQASADALLVVAPGEPVTEPWEPDDTWSPLPIWSPRLPVGEPLYRREDAHSRLLVTAEGVGRHHGPDRFVTVLWDTCAGVVGWDDGTRLLLGDDGAGLLVDPAGWPDGATLTGLVDAAAPNGVVPQGERPAAAAAPPPPSDRVDEPPEPPAPAETTSAGGRPSRWALPALGLLSMLGLGLVVVLVATDTAVPVGALGGLAAAIVAGVATGRRDIRRHIRQGGPRDGSVRP